MSRPVIWLLRFYKAAISPALPMACRYVPTCSEYCCEAVERFGVTTGLRLGLLRVLRCHPFHAGGYDPVPDRLAPAQPIAAKG